MVMLFVLNIGRWLVSAAIILIVLVILLAGVLPDEGQIAYGAWQYSNGVDIHLLDIRTGKSLPLTRHDAWDENPTWSPDGQWLAFESRREGYNSIFVMSMQGGAARPLARPPAMHAYNPRWSEDGQYVLFQTSQRLNAPLLAVHVHNQTIEYQPDQNPDIKFTPRQWSGQLFVMTHDHDGWGIALVSRDHLDSVVQLTTNDIRFSERPRWSPDYSQIAFISDGRGNTEIYLMNADGRNFRPLTNDGLIKRDLAWRP